MIPSLTIVIGATIHQAIGTTLLIDCIICGVAGLVFLKKGNVNLRSSFLLAFIGVIFSLIASRLSTVTPGAGLGVGISLIMIFIGVNFAINGIQKNVDFFESKINVSIFRAHKTVFLIIFGAAVGFINGFLGMGSGSIVAIVLIFILGYDIHTAIGTSLIMTFFIAGSGALGHAFNNNVIFDVALIAGFAAVVGSASGSIFANRIDGEKLGRIVGSIAFVLGIALFIRTFF
jgi:uncharacterized membrane protein YfcA